MDNSPLVSIIVVSYNHEKYIRENLDSIKRQTYTNIELIVADDASPDNSVEVFDFWLQENNYPAKKNYHTQNTGVATVLNECIEIATGKYIKIIAADDFLHTESIEKSVLKLEVLGEEYGMVFTNTNTVDDNSVLIKDIADYNQLVNSDPDIFRKDLLIGNKIAALTVLMRTKVVKETGKYDSQFLIEDYYRWLKINEKYLIAYIPEKLAFYRMHDTNISKLKADRIKKEDIFLKLIFDKYGIARYVIRDYLIMERIKKNNIDLNILQEYRKYPFRDKILTLSLYFNLPALGYKVYNKIINV
ncbi:glycosyltransferase family 2 protein [Elizabethkingia anophelis]|uniref:glycosyltransferase family 2 protein n=1 Tax=Elizabethkingia anophelis TaxID=1117645 RepID=UPI0021A69D7F|nr:glycosyltransferase family 2 protein [Elizabethkingia anophelis]MCT3960280.1 glycosyltransferase family 2 protein [Elizabethkingia anophelis]